MGGWSNDNRDTVTWDGNIKAKQFLGDGSLLTGGITGSGQSPRIAFWDGTNVLGSDSVFTWNKVSNILNVTGGDGAGSGSTFVFSDGLRLLKLDSTNGYTSNTPFTISGTNTFQNNAELEVNSLSGRNLITAFGSTWNFVVASNGSLGADLVLSNYNIAYVSRMSGNSGTGILTLGGANTDLLQFSAGDNAGAPADGVNVAKWIECKDDSGNQYWFSLYQ